MVNKTVGSARGQNRTLVTNAALVSDTGAANLVGVRVDCFLTRIAVEGSALSVYMPSQPLLYSAKGYIFLT
jgi:hypothetical protein